MQLRFVCDHGNAERMMRVITFAHGKVVARSDEADGVYCIVEKA